LIVNSSFWQVVFSKIVELYLDSCRDNR